MSIYERTPLSEIDQNFKHVACLKYGRFSKVFLAKKKSGRYVTLKFFDLTEQMMCVDAVDFDNTDRLNDNRRVKAQKEIDVLQLLKGTVHKLTNNEADNENEDDKRKRRLSSLSIVPIEQYFHGPDYVCIVMKYVNGGTLEQEIRAKTNNALTARQCQNNYANQPYTLRRIASYALQLCAALDHMHSHGIVHRHIEPSNVLIDRTNGGKLILADFGSATSSFITVESYFSSFNDNYAPPELQRNGARRVGTGAPIVDPVKIDAFCVGCILYECLCCKMLADLAKGQSLAEFINDKKSSEAAMSLPCICLPWIQTIPDDITFGAPYTVGYTCSLKSLVKNLLEPLPSNRPTPSEICKQLQEDPQSPLLMDFVPAAQPPRLGVPVTVDNIQLGMFVQRGPDWVDNNRNGDVGTDSVGVIIQLDPDTGSTKVAFPSKVMTPVSPTVQYKLDAPKTLVCRVGAQNKYDLQVGPTPMVDFYTGTTNRVLARGLVFCQDTSNVHAGQLINNNSCMVMGISTTNKNAVIIAPMEEIHIPPMPMISPYNKTAMVPKACKQPGRSSFKPHTWETTDTVTVDVIETTEQQSVRDAFFSETSGIRPQDYEIVSIKRIQVASLWDSYVSTRHNVCAQNWGIANERRLFLGTGLNIAPESLLGPRRPNWNSSLEFSDHADHSCFVRSQAGNDRIIKEVILNRVVLGRIDNCANSRIPTNQANDHKYHSTVIRNPNNVNLYKVPRISQAYPEYVICYARKQHPCRRVARPLATTRTNTLNISDNKKKQSTRKVEETALKSSSVESASTSRLATKLCVVCLDKDVCMILIPCGHPCLCKDCSREQELKKLKLQCPECRAPFKTATRFFGRVVED